MADRAAMGCRRRSARRNPVLAERIPASVTVTATHRPGTSAARQTTTTREPQTTPKEASGEPDDAGRGDPRSRGLPAGTASRCRFPVPAKRWSRCRPSESAPATSSASTGRPCTGATDPSRPTSTYWSHPGTSSSARSSPSTTWAGSGGGWTPVTAWSPNRSCRAGSAGSAGVASTGCARRTTSSGFDA